TNHPRNRSRSVSRWTSSMPYGKSPSSIIARSMAKFSPRSLSTSKRVRKSNASREEDWTAHTTEEATSKAAQASEPPSQDVQVPSVPDQEADRDLGVDLAALQRALQCRAPRASGGLSHEWGVRLL